MTVLAFSFLIVEWSSSLQLLCSRPQINSPKVQLQSQFTSGRVHKDDVSSSAEQKQEEKKMPESLDTCTY